MSGRIDGVGMWVSAVSVSVSVPVPVSMPMAMTMTMYLNVLRSGGHALRSRRGRVVLISAALAGGRHGLCRSGRAPRAKSRRSKRPALVWELLWTRTGVCAFEKTAFVA